MSALTLLIPKPPTYLTVVTVPKSKQKTSFKSIIKEIHIKYEQVVFLRLAA